MQKFLYGLIRDQSAQERFGADPAAAVAAFDPDNSRLTAEEVGALTTTDIGLLYHLGVNGQILIHFASMANIEWADYLQRMRDGLATHGPVREGLYATTGYEGTESHTRRLTALRSAPAPTSANAPAPTSANAPAPDSATAPAVSPTPAS